MEQPANACQEGTRARRSHTGKKTNWVHQFFWQPDELSEKLGKDIRWGNYRICKECWVGMEEKIPLDLSKGKTPGQQVLGCCSTGSDTERSPAQMQRHIKNLHPHLGPVQSVE